jgi:cytochrome c oxidase accessory protein FixG
MPPGEEFRDRISIVSDEGNRRWIYPKQPEGRFYRWRTALSAVLVAILFGVPFISQHRQPFMLFNLVERKFILFGEVFGPHDFFILGLGAIAFVVFVILFTVVFGRLFCGWVCPQTVLMEMVFRKIDYLIEGDYRAQQRLTASPWNGQKILKKGTKYAVYFALSFLIANMLLAWVIGIDRLKAIVTDAPSAHLGGLTAMLVFTGVFYWIFIWFREQACILICPYGRLQGVLLDRNSVVIAYDHVRGEPRGKLRRNEERKEGDCIDCGLCVEVCPTGIDIRNGTQLECVNCTACIDACDPVMERIQKPRGLIRYASANAIASGTGFRWTPRVLGYAAVLIVLVAVVGYLLNARTDLDVSILRSPGMFFQERPDGRISNVYDVKVLNKTFVTMPITVRLTEPPGEVQMLGGDLSVDPQGIVEAKMILVFSRDQVTRMSMPVQVGVYSGGRLLETVRTTFLGPAKSL